jgi:hypothetical protein
MNVLRILTKGRSPRLIFQTNENPTTAALLFAPFPLKKICFKNDQTEFTKDYRKLHLI